MIKLVEITSCKNIFLIINRYLPFDDRGLFISNEKKVFKLSFDYQSNNSLCNFKNIIFVDTLKKILFQSWDFRKNDYHTSLLVDEIESKT